VTQREVHVDVPSFAEALPSCLRQDPDIILVGELRDLETMEAAITAAETGHLFRNAAYHRRGQDDRSYRERLPMNQQETIRISYRPSATVISQLLLPRHDKPAGSRPTRS